MSIERLTSAARAAVFAMATPDDLHATTPRRADNGWKSAVPAVIEKPAAQTARSEQRGTALRDWFAMLSFRQPA